VPRATPPGELRARGSGGRSCRTCLDVLAGEHADQGEDGRVGAVGDPAEVAADAHGDPADDAGLDVGELASEVVADGLADPLHDVGDVVGQLGEAGGDGVAG